MSRVTRAKTATSKSARRGQYACSLGHISRDEANASWDALSPMQNNSLELASGVKISFGIPRRHSKKTTTAYRRNQGRGDGYTWNGDAFICSSQVDGADLADDEDMEDSRYHDIDDDDLCGCEVNSLQRRRFGAIALSDVLVKQVAKPKKALDDEFEMIPRMRRVLAMEHDYDSDENDDNISAFSEWQENLEYLTDEEWAELESSESEIDEEIRDTVPRRPTYAQAVRSKDR